MAKFEMIFQGMSEGDDHESRLKRLLAIRGMKSFLLVSAYVTRGGVRKLESELRRIGPLGVVYAGINNCGTTDGGLIALVDLGLELYVVDGGKLRNPIFHPKFFAAFDEKEAHIIMGSANLTDGGLTSNVEVSTWLDLDLTETDDRSLLEGLLGATDFLKERKSKNVYRIRTVEDVKRLLDLGFVEDQNRPRSWEREGNVRKIGPDDVPPLYTSKSARTNTQRTTDKSERRGCREPQEGFEAYFESVFRDQDIDRVYGKLGSVKRDTKTGKTKNRQPLKQIKNVNYNALFQEDGTIAGEISLAVDKFPNNGELFERLRARASEIQPHFDEPVEFLQNPERSSKDGKFIVVAREYPDNPTSEQQRELKRWHIETLVKLRKIVGPLIEEMID